MATTKVNETKKEKEEVKYSLNAKLFFVNNTLSTKNFSPTGLNDKQNYKYLKIQDSLPVITEVCFENNLGFKFSNFKIENNIMKDSEGNEVFKTAFVIQKNERGNNISMSTGELSIVIFDTETGEVMTETAKCTCLNTGDKAPQVLLTNLKKMLLAQTFYGVSQEAEEDKPFVGDMGTFKAQSTIKKEDKPKIDLVFDGEKGEQVKDIFG